MTRLDRRTFVGGIASLAATTCLAGPWPESIPAPQGRKFTMDLVCGAIGVGANQREAIRLAAAAGFESVQPSSGELKGMSQAQVGELLQTLRDNQLVRDVLPALEKQAVPVLFRVQNRVLPVEFGAGDCNRLERDRQFDPPLLEDFQVERRRNPRHFVVN